MGPDCIDDKTSEGPTRVSKEANCRVHEIEQNPLFRKVVLLELSANTSAKRHRRRGSSTSTHPGQHPAGRRARRPAMAETLRPSQ